MAFQILTTTAASITELKRDPMGTFNAGDGAQLPFLKRTSPAFRTKVPALMSSYGYYSWRMKNSVVAYR